MNIIFLDMDGVLASARMAMASSDKGLWSSVDIHAARFLSKVAREWPAKIVISSTWRINVEHHNWQYIFQGTDLFNQFHNCWKTPITSKGFRGNEIDLWIKNNNFTGNYLILDDNQDFHDHHEKHLILTDVYDGMLFKHYKKILDKTQLHGKL